ncbi:MULTISPECIES: spermidine/putrescine ABC transporter substrate-binding protein [unclassified Staphylococcus]|uniref:ABC transporter substrate-binding protein n=1 Tax=unclassified Staphylococcus TaxID=91994 RepID=UPI0021CFF6D6|nr:MULTISPECIES: spermidine/putrescine ABC transporter substrate-binding protein [unclassified Staphylococcus]UXR72268.1 spermidine/putrescine ABC transporter substrate-binding protein [Staphylococcus sp. IVB6240]UXR74576.1 spermidine/putrescine ABC transporter substrate-binding protein [Staphylococcus sp. IVB6238]UXR76961.1 spermidine/putrescine ABC transporter substrate-binding protein [Staphylococcus sp. IVB6233]UXR81087.1 spermidine/putrescine ABC transporter substrate-binding protein [Stap
MKQFVQLIGGALILGIISLGIGYWISHDSVNKEQQELYVYNWGEYIDPELIHQFEKETGIKVIYETFDSNEAMEAKIRNGGTHYDVAFPSDYTIEKMKKSQLLIPLDHQKIPNMKHLDSYYMDQPFDKNNVYSLPYFFGTVGILYDREKYPDMTFEHWTDLKDPRLANDVILVDGAREVIGFGLNSLGYSLNDTDTHHLSEAEAHLKTFAPNIRGVVGDEVTMMFEQHEASVAVIWSGSAAPLFQEDDRFDYVVPKDGSNLWFDNMVIPKTAQNVEGAHKFMNFLLDPKVNRQNTEWVAYGTPNKTAREMLPDEIKNDTRVYPTEETQKRLEVYKDLGTDVLSEYNERFLNFKMGL